jgi:hypothetical protein
MQGPARSKLTQAETALIAELQAAAYCPPPGSTFAVRVQPFGIAPRPGRRRGARRPK